MVTYEMSWVKHCVSYVCLVTWLFNDNGNARNSI